MIAVACEKPHAEKTEWVVATAQDYRSDKRFDPIFKSGHAFQVLLNDADVGAVFATMKRQLKPGG